MKCGFITCGPNPVLLNFILFLTFTDRLTSGEDVVATFSPEQEQLLVTELVKAVNCALAPIHLRLVETDDEYDDDNSYIVLVSFFSNQNNGN